MAYKFQNIQKLGDFLQSIKIKEAASPLMVDEIKGQIKANKN